MGIVSNKLRTSARGQSCTFQIPGVCNHDPETTVLCHIRDEQAGKSTKADDFSAAFGCSNCHAAIDTHWLSKEDELFYQLRGLQRTLRNWIERGLIVIPGNIDPKPKLHSKIMPRRSLVWPTGNAESD